MNKNLLDITQSDFVKASVTCHFNSIAKKLCSEMWQHFAELVRFVGMHLTF